MIFVLPIGIYLLFQEKNGMRKYQAIFDDFFIKMKQDKTLNNKEKIDLLEDMLHLNSYNIINKSQIGVIGEKRLFSMGWLFVGIGTFYIGLIVYLSYFFYFQKPHIVNFQLD